MVLLHCRGELTFDEHRALARIASGTQSATQKSRKTRKPFLTVAAAAAESRHSEASFLLQTVSSATVSPTKTETVNDEIGYATDSAQIMRERARQAVSVSYAGYKWPKVKHI